MDNEAGQDMHDRYQRNPHPLDRVERVRDKEDVRLLDQLIWTLYLVEKVAVLLE